MTELNFRGRRALVTGAASGIGAATARWLDSHGIAELVLFDQDRAGLEALDLGCRTARVHGDVADPSAWETLVPQLERLDHAVLNAGVAGAGKPIVELSDADWRRTVGINLDGVFFGLRAAMRAMAGRGGSIAILASVAAMRANASGDYGATKAAVAHLAKIAAREGGPQGIRVNAIAPGGVDTPIWDETPTFRKQVERFGGREAAIVEFGKFGNPLGRFASADEIAGQIGFLLSDMAATITGAVLVSDGGYSV